MVSATNTEKLEDIGRSKSLRRKRRSVIFSRLSRVIFMSHLIGLAILIAGSLVLNEYTQELVDARVRNLNSQATIITSILGDTATGFDLSAELDETAAKSVLQRLDLPDNWRVRLFDKVGRTVADTNDYDDRIIVTEIDNLDDIQPESQNNFGLDQIAHSLNRLNHNLPWKVENRNRLRWDLDGDVRQALNGDLTSGKRFDEDDNLIVVAAAPVRRVQQTLGAITVESRDVEDIIAAERRALMPFIGLAILAAILSSTALTLSIVLPLRHLAKAAERVSQSQRYVEDIPDYSRRGDEIGELSEVLRVMTERLSTRIDDIANFAADVAHEIKNPLTSLRSASDTLRHVKSDTQREKLIAIIQEDVSRMDRLISDISKASKVDANLAREQAEILNMIDMLNNLTEFYTHTLSDRNITVRVNDIPANSDIDEIYVRGFETPLAQVIRNLIDNAITFSPPDGTITITPRIERGAKGDILVIAVDDEGPGIPPDNLETVFERFYTERPKGAQFGSHSGLGLAICRQIMEAHNGAIRAENRERDGEVLGARFIVTLPRYRHKRKSA